VACGVCIARAGVDHDDFGNFSLEVNQQIPGISMKLNRSLSSIIVAVSPGLGAPYSRTSEISCAMSARPSEDVSIFDHSRLMLKPTGTGETARAEV
jgi:hypothetical protein